MRRRWVKVLTVLVVVLVALFVAADRVAVHEAEQFAAKKAGERYDLDNTAVDIHGFPFLTQAAGGSLDDVTLTARHMTVASTTSSLTVDRLRLDMRDMRVSSSFDSVRSGSVTGTVSIRWSALGATLGHLLDTRPVGISPVTPGGPSAPTEDVRLRGTVEDRDLPSRGVIAVSGNRLQIRVPGLTDEPAVAGHLTWSLPLPAGLSVTGFQADPDVLRVLVSGSGVTLGASGTTTG